MQHRNKAVAVLAVACAVGIAGCSSSGGGAGAKGAGGAGVASVDPALNKLGADHGWSQTDVTVNASSLSCQGKASNPTRGVTATSIKIGGIATLTSPAGAAFADVDKGAKARFERANAEGGVNGRKINFIGVKDDAQDPAKDATLAQELFQRDQVFAAAPVLTIGPNVLDTWCKAVVPFFGWGTNAAFCGNVIGFSIVGCQTPAAGQPRTLGTGTAAAAAQVLPAGASKTLALVGPDDDSARIGNVTVGQGFEAAGFKVVYEKTPIPRTGLTDPTPIVQAIMRSDKGAPPGAIFMVAGVADALKLVGAFKSAGYKGLVITPYYDPRLAGSDGLQNSYAAVQWQPGISTNVAAIAQMQKDFDAYAPGTALSLPSMAGYWSADMLVKALQKTGRNLTVDALLKTLNGGGYTNYVQGALAETRWPLGHIAAAPCGSLAHLADKKWTAPPLACGAIAKAP